ncbi:MAG: AraC family transcriptional regulator ligand-binding domain-containing protein [Pontixanthobacter sp.]
MSETTHLSRSAVLDSFAPVARQCGLDPYALMRAHDCPPGCLEDPDIKLSTSSVIGLLEDAARIAGEAAFGLRLAEARRASVLDAIGLIMREQPDVRSALNSLSRHGWAQVGGISFAIENDGEIAVLSLSLAAGLPRQASQALELTLAALVRVLRRFLGSDWVPEMVLFTHQRPASTALHLRAFGTVPHFAMDRDAIVLLSTDLDQTIAGSDPATARQLERYLEVIAGTRDTGTRERVCQIIQMLLPRGQCRADQVSRQFGVDRRTLHRWLAEDGASFSGLVNEVRQQLFREYETDGSRSLTEISDLLGFSSLSALSRWKRCVQAA